MTLQEFWEICKWGLLAAVFTHTVVMFTYLPEVKWKILLLPVYSLVFYMFYLIW